MSVGFSRISLRAPCHQGEKVRLRYDLIDLVRRLDNEGALEMVFDCFAGDKPPLAAVFQDGSSVKTSLKTVDLDRVTKIAVSWKAPVNLDLHAFEYAAAPPEPGHVWAGSPSSRWEVEERMRKDGKGHGFLGLHTNGSTEGDQIEVYTFLHSGKQEVGAITISLDYESRARNQQDPDSCGTGLYADLEYRVIMLHPSGRISRSRGQFAAIPCNTPVDEKARYSSKAMPQLILTR
jgi:hypothetical protein